MKGRQAFSIVLMAAVSLVWGQNMSDAQTAQGKGLAPWADNTNPTDVPRQHVEEITAARHEYAVVQGGTMDGENCRQPVGVWFAYKQLWESNRAVRMENIGVTDVVNPWLSNGRNNYRTIPEIIASLTLPGMTDREKAIALYYGEATYRWHHAAGGGAETGDPVKLFNVRGYSACGDNSVALAGLWQAAGIKACPAFLVGHCISEAYYDGGWHLMDGDMQSLYMRRDNKTIASAQELARDHDLIRRTRVHGILSPDSPKQSESEAAQYVYEGPATGTRDGFKGHTMNMVLRPGEALVWRWGHRMPLKYQGSSHPRDQVQSNDWLGKVCNGLWEYRPNLAGDLWRRGAEIADGILATPEGLAAEPGKVGTVVWLMRSPYPFVGGHFDAEGTGAKFALSKDGTTWQDMTTGILDYQFPSEWGPWYEYRLRCQLEGDARLKALLIVSDVQMAPPALPGMVVGRNAFVYSDESPDGRKVRITHEWVERSATRPPEAPARAAFPPDGGESDGSEFAFQWAPASDPDGDEIADYRFELSERPDLKWPLSPNFAKLISLTADKGKAQYTLPFPGLLAPDTRYYWRVRAMDANGVWGPWSQVWSFTARCVACPVDVVLEFDQQQNLGVLRWKPNAEGRRPVKYRVYGSDEKGFFASDSPYDADVGNQEQKLPLPFSANFVAETDKTELVVVGEGLDLPNANKAYYRVVAVDDKGKRSYSSDYVEAPRPFIYTRPVTEARIGQQYRYQLSAIRSIGDLRSRSGGRKAYWDMEKPKFALVRGPTWLKIDQEGTGLLTGTPDAPGRAEVEVTATTDKEVRTYDLNALMWGNEKVEVATKRMGPVSQRFVIDVHP
jgi:hypothetical protein